MPDVVVVSIPKTDQPSEGLFPAPLSQPHEALKPPPPKSLLAKLWRLLFLPVRIARSFLRRLVARLRKRVLGAQAKP